MKQWYALYVFLYSYVHHICYIKVFFGFKYLEFYIMVREKSGKSQGILFGHECGHPARRFYPWPIWAAADSRALRHLSVCPSVCPPIHPALVTTLQPTLSNRYCSYLGQLLTLEGTWTLLIMGFLCSFSRVQWVKDRSPLATWWQLTFLCYKPIGSSQANKGHKPLEPISMDNQWAVTSGPLFCNCWNHTQTS